MEPDGLCVVSADASVLVPWLTCLGELLLNTTVYLFAVQVAVIVRFSVTFVYDPLHPANVYPVLDGLAGGVASLLYSTGCVLRVVLLWPSMKVTVYVLIFHLAVSVTDPLTV